MSTKAEMNILPSRDAIVKHLMRTNYQAEVHARRDVLNSFLISLAKHASKEIDTTSEAEWGDLLPAPTPLLELTYWSCKKNCCEESKGEGKGRGSCRQHKVTCTDLYRCINRQNLAQARNDGGEDSDNMEEN